MNLFHHINIITILMIGIFLIPLLTGLLHPITSNRIQHTLLTMLNYFKFISAAILAFGLIRIIFSGKGNWFFETVYQINPAIGDFILHYNNDILAYVIAMFLFLFIILWILDLITIPLQKFIITPLADRLSLAFSTMNCNMKKVLSVVWNLPKAVCMVLIFSLLLSFYTNYINNPTAGEYINRSSAYQIIDKSVLQPVLSTKTAKNMPVLINDSFKKASEDFASANNYWNIPVITYFNGMTLNEAVKSNSEIDNAAKEIVGTETNDRKKAYLLYEWISKNIQYDKGKAEIIVKNPSHVNSGSIVTYEEREGICFDYASLYISMCRAVGLKVRFVSGLGYNGTEWGDHAWNQVYDSSEDRWINVDTTFGITGRNYFDNEDFTEDHKYDVVQSEW